MRNLTLYCSLLLFIPAVGPKLIAQDAPKLPDTAKPAPPPAHYYHLDYVVQELAADGKPVNSRAYATTISTDRNDTNTFIRTGSRIPIITGSKPGASGSEKSEIQYIDVGIQFSTHGVHEIGNQLAISVGAEVTSLADTPGSITSDDPVIRQHSWSGTVLVPIGKPTVVFSSDALENKGSMQLVLTAKPLQ
jgi:hypothetical protein